MITLLAALVTATARADINVNTQTLNVDHRAVVVSIYKEKKDDEHGSRLEIKVDNKQALNLKTEVCIPEENFKDPGCDKLKFRVKNEKLLEIRNEMDASSVDQASQTFLYRWQNKEFQLIGATAENWNTGQVQERENSKTDINYSTGKATEESWTENDKGTHGRSTKKCTLKTARKNESLAKFSNFNILEQVTCSEK